MSNQGASLTRHDVDRQHKFDWQVNGFEGMDNSSDPSTLSNNITPNTINTIYDLTGATETRKGYTKVNTTSFPGAIINEFPFYKSDGVTKYIVFAGNATNSGTAPTSTPGVALTALTASTTLGIGLYRYRITFTTGAGETTGGTEFSITTTSGNQSIILTGLPTGGANVTGRKIYRTAVGGATNTEKLVVTIADNTTTTYTDAVADGSLGATLPGSNTAGGLTGSYLCYYDNAGSYVIIGGPYATGTFWDFTTINDSVYACNGTDGVFSWTGSGNFVLSNAAKIRFIENRKNRLYGLIGSILYFTDAGNLTSWPANNYIQVNTNDGQTGMGLKKYFDDLVIFKSQSVWYMQGEPLGSGSNTTIGNLQLRQADSEVGCSSILTVKKVRRGVLMWACESGIAVMQNYHVDLVSQKIEKTFAQDMNTGYLNTMWAVYSPPEKKYLLGYPSSSSQTPDKVIMVDLSDPRSMKFAIWDHFPGSSAILFRFSGRDSVVVGHPTKGYLVQAFTGYADIAGDNGTVSAAGSTTLTDGTKSWTTNAFVDADVTIVSGTGAGQQRSISANTSTQLTITSPWTVTPDTTSVYSIGAYANYIDTPIEDFGKAAYDKKVKYFNLFSDAKAGTNLLFGYATAYQALAFSDSKPLNGGGLAWEGVNSPDKWGAVGKKWGNKKQLFIQFEIGDADKHFQARWGNNRSLQPWRVSKYSVTLKFKKVRPDVV